MPTSECKFIKYYKPPPDKYVVVSFSVFYNKKYIRHTRKSTFDNTISKQLSFIYNLTLNINNLKSNKLPKNWYIRIYYDKSIFKFKYNNTYPWKVFIKQHSNFNRVQFVEYNCPKFIKDGNHINLFGTMIRLYPIFLTNENTSLVIIFDADNTITDKYVNAVNIFMKTKYDYSILSSKYQSTLYMNDYDKDTYKDYYISMGMLICKIKFKHSYWNKLLEKISVLNSSSKFNKLITKLDKIHTLVRPNRKVESYRNFEYGMDEIIINYYLQQLFDKYNYKIYIIRFQPMVLMIYNRFELFLKYNLKNNENIVNNIINNIMSKLSNKYTKNNFNKNMNIINRSLYIFLLNNNFKYEILFKRYIKPVRDNIDELSKLFMPLTIIYFFKNIKKDDFKVPVFSDYMKSTNVPENYLLANSKSNKSNPLKIKNISK